MATIPDTWYDQKVQDEIATIEQSAAMKAYINGQIQADEAARLVTADVLKATEEDTGEGGEVDTKLLELWGFIIDFISEWPSSHPKILDLLYTIRKLPHIDRSDKDSIETFQDDTGIVRESQLWDDLPKFWNMLSDFWDSEAAWRHDWTKSSLGKGESPSWFNINAFAATAFKGGPFMGTKLFGYWGCDVLKMIAKKKRELFDIDIPVAEIWMQSAGAELHNFYLTRFRTVSPLDTWEEWEKAFRGIASDDKVDATIREKAAGLAAAMGQASAISEGEKYENLQITLAYANSSQES
ncbi:hypothetical protein F5Y13DRAFT_2057 [Hypoxylon sp. FL1857]|nr:hypothetical protein F5Y13DRAFT_2057 [Hypoxylon sp. FL1857]